MKRFLFILTCLGCILGAPTRSIPKKLLNAFTDNGRIPIYEWYINSTRSSKAPDDWSPENIETNIGKIRTKQQNLFGKTDIWLSFAFSNHRSFIEGKEVGILSSLKPWYASFVLEYGGSPIALEHIMPRIIDSRIKIQTVTDYLKKPQKFDAIVSISNIQHDGLGRFNESLNPYGDIIAMNNLKSMLKPGGLLFLAVPVCSDSITFNAHRTYGKIQLPKLLKGWTVVDHFGFFEHNYTIHPKKGYTHQPVFVLRAK